MKHVTTLLLLVLCCIGCASSHQIIRVVGTDQYMQINTMGLHNRAVITVEVDSIVAMYSGDEVSVASDSTWWFDPQTLQGYSTATSNLRRIRFYEKGSDILMTTALGAAPGAIVLIVGSIWYPPNENAWLQYPVVDLGKALMLSGALTGLVVGATTEVRTDFVFPPP